MGDETYQSLLAVFLVLQYQFTSFVEERPQLKEEMIVNDDQRTGLTHQRALGLDYPYRDMDMNYQPGKGRTNEQEVNLDFDGLNQLTELEEWSIVLEGNLRRVMIRISRSQSHRPRLRKHVKKLLRRLKTLQDKLRAAIKKGRSTGRRWRRLFSRMFTLEHENQVRERSPLRFQSCPNIPSVLEDLDFNNLRKTESMNRTIGFKDSLDDLVKAIDNDLNLLEKQGAGQGNKSDSSEIKETACNATSHSSDQSEQHRDTEDDRSSEPHCSYSNNPDVSPSQRIPRARNVTTAATSGETMQSLSSQSFPWARNVTTATAATAATAVTTSGERIQSLSSQDTEDDSSSEPHCSYRNNPDVATSQRIHRACNFRERIESLSSQDDDFWSEEDDA